MPRFRVESIEDPRLKPYRELRTANLTRYSGQFVAEGRLVVERLLKSSLTVESIFLDEPRAEALAGLIPAEVPVYVGPTELMEQVVGFHFHRGVLACGHRRPILRLDDVPPPTAERLMVVACSGVQDPENLGVILRSAAALGIDLVLLGNGCADAFSRRVLRVSVGTVFRLPIVESLRLGDDLVRLRDEWQVELAATVCDASAEPLHRASRPARFGLVFGSEGDGLDRRTQDLCVRRITIPMAREIDSLNVSVAAGIFLHHFARESASAPAVR